jgi:hypothetical protein
VVVSWPIEASTIQYVNSGDHVDFCRFIGNDSIEEVKEIRYPKKKKKEQREHGKM